MGKNVIISTLPNISQNYLPKVNTSNIFANSLVYDNGTNVMVNTTTANTDYTGARLVVSNTSNSYLEVRSTAGQSAIVLTTATSTTSNFPTVEIFNSADFGIVAYRPGVVSSNYLMYYELSSSTNRRLTFQTEGVTRLGIQGAGRILMGPTLPTDDGSTALQVNGGGKFSSSVTATSESFITGGDGAGKMLKFTGGTTKYNFMIAAQQNVNNGLEITPSSAAGGNTFSTPAIVITSGGNVLIGTTSDNGDKFQVTGTGSYFKGTSTYNTLQIDNSSTSGGGGIYFRQNGTIGGGIGLSGWWLGGTSNDLFLVAESGRNIRFHTNASATERMRITSGGYLKASNNNTHSTTGDYHDLRNSASGSDILYMVHSGASPYGIEMRFSGASPNNTGNFFFWGEDSTALRIRLNSDGGLANYQANNQNLSDIRTKKDIVSLESYWDKFKALEIVKFKYNDQTHDDYNIGVIAQQVESVAPEFVDVDGWGETPEDGVPLKSIYTADLYHATIKVLQEAMAKIESLEKELDTLKNK